MDYENRRRAGKVEFVSADDLVSTLEEKKPEYNSRIERPARPKKAGRRRKK